MNSKLIGGILLVVGTTIGAGMLALPVATAQLGFWGATALLIACWAIMTASAFVLLEVNLLLPQNTNIISMAGATLGRFGQAMTWVVYLVLLYSILSAYIAGGGDLFHMLFSKTGLNLSLQASSILFTALLGSVVYFGIRAVDYVNRSLMLGKMGSYALLVVFILPFVSMVNLSSGDFSHILSPTSITVTVLAFTCGMIIPSLRNYFGEDVRSLKLAIFWGTLIPLVCYILWDMVVMGVLPLDGMFGLKKIAASNSSNSELVLSLSAMLQKDTVTAITKFFTSICMATSFLSVGLSLFDFLSDGLNVKKQGLGKWFILSWTFVPPIIFVLFFPGAFLMGLNYAGICCLILMILLPALMAWRARSNNLAMQVEGHSGAVYQMVGGKWLLGGLIVFSTIMSVFGILKLV